MKEFWRYAFEDGKINEYKCIPSGTGFYYANKNGNIMKHTKGELSRLTFGKVTAVYTLYLEERIPIDTVRQMFLSVMMKKFWKQTEELKKTIDLANQLRVLKGGQNE